MHGGRAFDLPPEKAAVARKARRLEIWTLAYLASSALLLGLAMAGSQAMRTSFFEDIFSTLPAIVFLVCLRLVRRAPDEKFPYGLHGAVPLGYLAASAAILVLGAALLAEAALKIAADERTTIGATTLFGQTMWAGWPMLGAIAWSGIPVIFLGRAKLALALQVHDKILHADAKMMRADWSSELATAVGVLGVGFGFWWLDPLAASVVSALICKDGVANLRIALRDLVGHRPMKMDSSGPDPLPRNIEARLEQLDWVEAAFVRLREAGHVYFGEAVVFARADCMDLPARIREATEAARSLSWRLYDLTITVRPWPAAGHAPVPASSSSTGQGALLTLRDWPR